MRPCVTAQTKPTGQTALEPPAHPGPCLMSACIHMEVMLSTVMCVTLSSFRFADQSSSQELKGFPCVGPPVISQNPPVPNCSFPRIYRILSA